VSTSPFMELVRSRRSGRRYDPRPVPLEHILSAVEAARLAPSAENLQPCRYVVVTDPRALAALARACFTGIYLPTRFAAHAPAIVALCTRRLRLIQAKATDELDCGIAGEHLVLRATELGLATCWIEWFSRRGARRALAVPAGMKVIALIALGYPDAQAGSRQRMRKPLESLVWLDRWGRRYPGDSEK
jgi:nitroreductase